MKNKIILILVSVLLLFNVHADKQYVLGEEEYQLNITLPLSFELKKDYVLSPEMIVIRTGDSVDLIGGQAFISKYRFENKLNYEIVIDFEIESDVDKKHLIPYFVEEMSVDECFEANGVVLNYGGERIEIKNNDKKTNLCYFRNHSYNFNNNTLVKKINLKPGITTKYLLVMTSPALYLNSEKTSLTIKESMVIDEEEFKSHNQIYEEEKGKTQTSDNSLVSNIKNVYNNQIKKINENISKEIDIFKENKKKSEENIETQDDEGYKKDLDSSSLKSENEKDRLQNTSDYKSNLEEETKPKKESLKGKITGFVTFKPSPLGITIFIILLAFGVFFIFKKRNKKEKGLKK